MRSSLAFGLGLALALATPGCDGGNPAEAAAERSRAEFETKCAASGGRARVYEGPPAAPYAIRLVCKELHEQWVAADDFSTQVLLWTNTTGP